jgi:hypothetical protein
MRRTLGLLLACSFGSIGAVGALPQVASAATGCPKALFVGTIERDDDAANDQDAATIGGPDVRTAVAVDFGTARNTTVYVSDARIAAADVGGTITAEPTTTIATIFLRPKAGDLAPGKKVVLPRDQISVVVDTGGGARATTSGAEATAKVLAFTKSQICFSIDYRDDLQRVKGKVRAKFVRPS